jgi:hypothetical protein
MDNAIKYRPLPFGRVRNLGGSGVSGKERAVHYDLGGSHENWRGFDSHPHLRLSLRAGRCTNRPLA